MDIQERRKQLAEELERMIKMRNEVTENILRFEGAILLCDELLKQEQEAHDAQKEEAR